MLNRILQAGVKTISRLLPGRREAIESDQEISNTVQFEIERVISAFEAKDFTTALHRSQSLIGYIADSKARVTTSDTNFIIWAQARALMAVGKPADVRQVLDVALQVYRELPIRSFMAATLIDFCDGNPGEPYPPYIPIMDAIVAEDFKSARFIMSSHYKACEQLFRDGTHVRMADILDETLDQTQVHMDPLSFYIGLQARQYLAHGTGYEPTPLEAEIPNPSPNEHALTVFANDITYVAHSQGEEAAEATAQEYRQTLEMIALERLEHHEAAVRNIRACRDGEANLVLYLRSFRNEATGQTVDNPFRSVDCVDKAIATFTNNDRSVEQRIAQSIPDGALAVSIANAADLLAGSRMDLRIPRLALGDMDWRPVLMELVERSAAVISWISELSPGAAYELRCLNDFGMAGKVLLVDGRADARASTVTNAISAIIPEITEARESAMRRLDDQFSQLTGLLPDPGRQIIDSRRLKEMEPQDVMAWISGAIGQSGTFVSEARGMDLYFKNTLLRRPEESRAVLTELRSFGPIAKQPKG